MPLHRNYVGLLAVWAFASVSVLGHGLHLLPAATHLAPHSHACCHCHHHGATPGSESDTTSGHDCPICSFLAQAQLPTEFCLEQPLTQNCELLDDRQPLCLAHQVVALHLARAPPLAA